MVPHKLRVQVGKPRRSSRTERLVVKEVRGEPLAASAIPQEAPSAAVPAHSDPPHPSPPPEEAHAPLLPMEATVLCPSRLPAALQRLGNSKAWQQVMAHLNGVDTRQRPLVVWGPTGCGKTCGVKDLAASMRYRLMELDGSDGDDTDQLLTWIKRARDGKALRGPTAVLLDDYESFTDDARKRIATMLAGTAATHRTRLGPIVITCTQLRDPQMKDMQAFAHVRLFAPHPQVCREWFDRNGILVEKVRDGQLIVLRSPAGPGWSAREAKHLATRDLRRVGMALQWRALTNTSLLSGSTAEETRIRSSFQGIELLLLRKITASCWAAEGNQQDIDLIREHIPKYVDGDMDSLVQVTDALSYAVVCRPSRFECASSQHPFVMEMVGQATRCSARTQDVGALFPPARVYPSWDRTQNPLSSCGRPRSRAELREIPGPLHGSESRAVSCLRL